MGASSRTSGCCCTVSEDSNFSQVSDGTSVSETKYRRLRIDPLRLEIDPLDTTFATTTNGDAHSLPNGGDHVPAGWAEWNGEVGAGPAAEAQLDFDGTAFALSEDADGDSGFFCVVNSCNGSVAGSDLVVSNDLAKVTLSAASAAPGLTRSVADCDHLGTLGQEAFDSARWPLQYNGGTARVGSSNRRPLQPKQVSLITACTDTVAPTLVITTSDDNLTFGDTAIITFTLSEAAVDFTVADIVVTGGDLSAFTAVSGTVYTATLPPLHNDTQVTIDVVAGVFTDAAANGNVAAQLIVVQELG